MNSLRSGITLLLAVALPARAVNIAPGGLGIMGATGGSSATAYYHSGQLSHLCDGNPATRVDNFHGSHEYYHTHGYAGVGWTAARKESVKSLTVTMATFADAGWFGTREVPPAGSALTPAQLRPSLTGFSPPGDMLVEPIVQITRAPAPAFNGGWLTVASTNDYVASFTGHVLPPAGGIPTSRSFTLTLLERQVGITGIRVMGSMGGTGYIGVYEIAVDADPVVDADNDQMDDAWEVANGLDPTVNDANTDGDDDDGLPDAWEIEKFGTITAHDADDDPDADGSNALLEYGFNMNPHTFDTPPAATMEDNYLTFTLTKRPFVTYRILTGSSLQDLSTTDTTSLINDDTTLKVRDNFPITGPAPRRFLKVTVTAAP